MPKAPKAVASIDLENFQEALRNIAKNDVPGVKELACAMILEAMPLTMLLQRAVYLLEGCEITVTRPRPASSMKGRR